MTESALIAKVKKGDYKAFESLYNSYFAKTYAFLHALRLGDNAEDIIQETFITIWQKRESLDPLKSFNSYLFTIAKNYALKDLKNTLGERTGIEQVTIPDTLFTESKLEAAELEQVIQKSLNELPDRAREVFLLRRYEGFSVNQIAAKLGIAPSTVENHMNTALTLLKKHIIYAVGILPFIR